MTKKTATVPEFAKKVGVSRQRVADGIKTGILAASVKKKKKGTKTFYEIDLEAGLKEWAANIDPAKQRDNDKQAATRELNGGAGTSSSNFQRAKAVRETFAAKLAQLEYEEKSGKLVPADKVRAEAFKISRRVRDSIMGLPERVAAELATMTEPREISVYLRSMLADTLKDLGDINHVASHRS